MQRVVPAILTSDPADLRQKLELFHGHSNWMHIDIMDGTFVPGRTVNLFGLGGASKFFNLEIHLMVEDPFKYFEDCKEVGAKRVVFHYEAESDVEKAKKEAEKYEIQMGLVLNPSTGVQPLAAFKQLLDSVLLMGVEPGAQGRPFDAAVLPKVKKVKEMHPDLLCGVDGGIGKENIQSVFLAGVDYVVVGSEIIQAEQSIEALRSLEEMVQ